MDKCGNPISFLGVLIAEHGRPRQDRARGAVPPARRFSRAALDLPAGVTAHHKEFSSPVSGRFDDFEAGFPGETNSETATFAIGFLAQSGDQAPGGMLIYLIGPIPRNAPRRPGPNRRIENVYEAECGFEILRQFYRQVRRAGGEPSVINGDKDLVKTQFGIPFTSFLRCRASIKPLAIATRCAR